MPVPLALTALTTTALAAYLDAKFQISSDIHTILSGNVKSYVASRLASKTVPTYYTIEAHAQRRPDHLVLIYEDGREWSYAQFLREINKVANWLVDGLGVKEGEIVAVNYMNKPEYLMLWFALDAIGATIAKVNFNLRERPLEHCIKVCKARYLITDPEVKGNVQTAADEIRKSGTEIIYFTPEIHSSMKNETRIPDERRRNITLDEPEALLFTSGTTGLPKATIFPYDRALAIGKFVSKYIKISPNDRYFTCMPLYHGAAHGLCTLPVLHAGATLVLGYKFSHKTFWPTAVRTGATKAQYVGELLRYLLSAPPSPLDKAHKVKLVFGNGLRPDIWEAFRERFNIPNIVELYAASDGVGSSFHWNTGEFGRGGIARRGPLTRWLLRKSFVLFKVQDEELVRGADGFCIKAGEGEPGEAMTEMDPALIDTNWKGYYGNKEAGDKRLIRDVLKKGDLWFRSNDLLRVDSDGVYYFVDRLGDTFRWRSENVSTNEVADILSAHPQLIETNVYGIKIPHHEGRCGCAAIVLAPNTTTENFDFEKLARTALSQLPRYAVPLFLRVTKTIETTGNLKQMKTVIRGQGADLGLIGETGDQVFWLKGDRYVRFDMADWEELQRGRVRL